MKAPHLIQTIQICSTALLLFSCIEPFEPNVERYENIYVVDGELNNLPGPYEVKLFQSNRYGSDSTQAVSNAMVTITDDANNEVLLNEIEPGVYSTVNSNYLGVPGRKYKLRIQTDQDTVLESDFIEMPQPTEIENVYWEFEDRSSYAGVTGLQMYIDSYLANNNTGYLAWEYEEYWEFKIRYLHKNFPDHEVCWDSSMIHPFILGTTAGLSENVLKRKRLYFVNNQSTRLTMRYTTLVKQYTISEKAYNFYQDFQLLIENTGGLFDPIPFSLEGNMHNVTAPDIPVLGLFQVAGIDTKRIFIDAQELPDELIAYDGFEYCELRYVSFEDTATIQMLQEDEGWLHYDEGEFQIVLINDRECFLCTENGTNLKPNFWID